MLVCLCILYKATAHVEKKVLNMRHQTKKWFRGIFIGIPQYKKGYLLYVPSTTKIIYSYYFVSDENKFIALAYTWQPYTEVIATFPDVSYTPYGKYLISIEEVMDNLDMI